MWSSVIGFDTNIVDVAKGPMMDKHKIRDMYRKLNLPLRFRNCVRVVSHLRL